MRDDLLMQHSERFAPPDDPPQPPAIRTERAGERGDLVLRRRIPGAICTPYTAQLVIVPRPLCYCGWCSDVPDGVCAFLRPDIQLRCHAARRPPEPPRRCDDAHRRIVPEPRIRPHKRTMERNIFLHRDVRQPPDAAIHCGGNSETRTRVLVVAGPRVCGIGRDAGFQFGGKILIANIAQIVHP